jgi:hypothetical protein
VLFEIVGVTVFDDAADLYVGKGEGLSEIPQPLGLLNGFLEDLAIELDS